MTPFHGSYRPEQVTFLLKPIELAPITDTAAKEALIQSGQKHYSEMLSPEYPPSDAYLALFRDACAQNDARLAADCLRLAALIAAKHRAPPALVSLARAGTPVGVILRDILARHYRAPVAHYSISIIRDRGIDQNALRHILARHAAESLVFIDGWTGKGVIARELDRAIAAYNRTHHTAIDPGLYVLADLSGTAACAASSDDYLIPTALLNATISGLISRSILNEHIGADDYHGCVYYDHLRAHDQSQTYADRIAALCPLPLPAATAANTRAAAATSAALLARLRARYRISDDNLIKPGIGETTRVLLRRQPERLLLRDPDAAATRHLVRLAQEKHVAIEHAPKLPYHAVGIIRSHRPGATP